jgi:superfamily II DNA helicase RecQ
MGIDKSDVNWAVHWDVPDTLEGYYQEVGRGGRGGQEASAYLLFHQQDVARLQKGITDLPNPMHALEFYNRFCSRFQIATIPNAKQSEPTLHQQHYEATWATRS